MINTSSSGDYGKTITYLGKLESGDVFKQLDKYAELGIIALARATPVDSGETAHSWYAKISSAGNRHKIEWFNSHNDGGAPVAVLIQYGHGTGTGGYVAGRDFINPAMRSIFDKAIDDIWRQVKNG